jgi:hypothetical protein
VSLDSLTNAIANAIALLNFVVGYIDDGSDHTSLGETLTSVSIPYLGTQQ